MWHVEAGPGRPALLLGPLAVDPAIQGQGLGSVMMQAALGRAESLGHGVVLLVGDAPYYVRFGFDRALAEGLTLPGPFERGRFHGRELRAGALAGAEGIGRPAGAAAPAERVADEAVAARRRAA